MLKKSREASNRIGNGSLWHGYIPYLCKKKVSRTICVIEINLSSPRTHSMWKSKLYLSMNICTLIKKLSPPFNMLRFQPLGIEINKGKVQQNN
jgi:hypothetical protein